MPKERTNKMFNIEKGARVKVTPTAKAPEQWMEGTVTVVGGLFPAKSRMAFRWVTVKLDSDEGSRSVIVTDDKISRL